MVARQNTAFTCVLSLARHYVFENRPFLFGNHPIRFPAPVRGQSASLCPRRRSRCGNLRAGRPTSGRRAHSSSTGTPGAPASLRSRGAGRLGGRRCTGGLGRGRRLADVGRVEHLRTRARPARSGRACRARRSPGHARTRGTPVLTVASLTSPHSGHVLFNTKFAGLKHISASLPPHEAATSLRPHGARARQTPRSFCYAGGTRHASAHLAAYARAPRGTTPASAHLTWRSTCFCC